jgi:hypothetical protein
MKIMKKHNNSNNLSLNNTQTLQNNNNKVLNNKIIFEKNLNNNNINSKQRNTSLINNMLIISKKRAITNERSEILTKQNVFKKTGLRSKSNFIDNKFTYDNQVIKFVEKQNIKTNILPIDKNSLKENKIKISLPNEEIIDVYNINNIKETFKEYARLNSFKNKSLLELNMKLSETKKKLNEKFIEQKISLYEVGVLEEFSYKIKDFYEEIKNKQLILLEEKEKLLNNKKIHNKKIFTHKEFYKRQMEKQRKLQEEYDEQIKNSDIKVIN